MTLSNHLQSCIFKLTLQTHIQTSKQTFLHLHKHARADSAFIFRRPRQVKHPEKSADLFPDHALPGESRHNDEHHLRPGVQDGTAHSGTQASPGNLLPDHPDGH